MRHIVSSRFPPLALAASILATSTVSAFAQRVPRRPRLDAQADTNSAHAYYRHGMMTVRTDPGTAADAFFWASQIDPTWAQPFYARRIALLLAADSHVMVSYFERDRRVTRSRQVARIDSLELRARMLSPLLNRELDWELVRRYVLTTFDVSLRPLGPVVTNELRFHFDGYLRTEAPPFVRAVLAANERRFRDALGYYRQALSDRDVDPATIHMARGEIFYLIGNFDSARVEMEQALASLRGRDATDFVYLYESKGVVEHSIALICEKQGQFDQAREAYARALQEDLSYYPAHVRLGLMHLAAGDTAAALAAMELAFQIEDDDPWVRATYGAVLADVGHLAEAEQHLRRAAELAPFYAVPHYALGRIAELANKPSDALRHYQAYLARAPAQGARNAEVRRRLADLGDPRP